MIYSEAAYFDGNHCQHVADWLENARLVRIWNSAQKAARGGR